jgi:hypothetical protein
MVGPKEVITVCTSNLLVLSIFYCLIVYMSGKLNCGLTNFQTTSCHSVPFVHVKKVPTDLCLDSFPYL